MSETVSAGGGMDTPTPPVGPAGAGGASQGPNPFSPQEGQAGGPTSALMSGSPNPGLMQAGLQQVSIAVRLLEASLMKIGSHTDVGQEVMKSLKGLSKFLPQGPMHQGAMSTELRRMQQEQMRHNAPMLSALRGQGAGGPQNAGGPSPAPQG